MYILEERMPDGTPSTVMRTGTGTERQQVKTISDRLDGRHDATTRTLYVEISARVNARTFVFILWGSVWYHGETSLTTATSPTEVPGSR